MKHLHFFIIILFVGVTSSLFAIQLQPATAQTEKWGSSECVEVISVEHPNVVDPTQENSGFLLARFFSDDSVKIVGDKVINWKEAVERNQLITLAFEVTVRWNPDCTEYQSIGVRPSFFLFADGELQPALPEQEWVEHLAQVNETKERYPDLRLGGAQLLRQLSGSGLFRPFWKDLWKPGASTELCDVPQIGPPNGGQDARCLIFVMKDVYQPKATYRIGMSGFLCYSTKEGFGEHKLDYWENDESCGIPNPKDAPKATYPYDYRNMVPAEPPDGPLLVPTKEVVGGEALREWQAAANAGDAKAMLALGRLYRQGLGAVQDYIRAHMWFNLAASRGEAEAVTERDALAARMAPEQVAKAQEQAAAWQPQAATAPAASSASQSAGPPPPNAIREAQELLTALGYEPDPPDGQWSKRTAQAYQAFVRDANLPMTDTLTPATLKAMRTLVRQAGSASTPKPKATLSPDALHRAAKAGNLKGLEAALAAGADVNARDDRGWTALMYTVDKGYVLLVGPLLQAKADPDVRAPDGATALFMAVAHGYSEIIPMLMQAGADPMIEGPKGKTATDLAEVRYDMSKKGTGEALYALKQETKKVMAALLLGLTLDDFAFHRARLQRTPEAYADYVASYPSGRHLEKVHHLQTELSQPPRLLTVTSPAGTTARECAKCPEMVVVPAGRFRMGDLSKGESEMFLARPVHEVTIDYKFAVGKYEVTLAEWDACVAAGGCTNRLDEYVNGVNIARGTMRDGALSPMDSGLASFGIVQNPGIYPAMNVSWDDAQEYVRWLSRETGKSYRLLSEAEWEYAARAGTTTKYWWGNGAPQRKVREWEVYFIERGGEYPVGHFEPNPFGLFDTEGNVREWVADCWAPSYEGAPNDGSARTDEGWFSGTDCDHRVIRGLPHDRFGDFTWVSPSADRSLHLRDLMGAGFRCARTLD